MKTLKKVLTIIAISTLSIVNAQEKKNEVSKESKTSYYKKRATEDAKFEQQYTARNKKEEKKFWKEQKAYEKELEKKDKEAHEAYIQGKKDAYAEHHNHCNIHCSHGYYYHNHARFYYTYEYRRQQKPRNTVRTNVRVGLPSVRIGFF